jgi:hypothetical protein
MGINFRIAVVTAAALTCGLPVAVGADTQSYTVDCARGQRVSDALERGDERKPMTLPVSGTCTENISILRDDVSLTGKVGTNPTLAAPNAAAPALTIRGTRITVDRLTVSGGSNAILVTGTHDVTITNSVIRNAAQHGLFVESGNLLLRGSVSTGNGASGVFLRYSRARLEGNQIHANSGAGVNAQQQSVVSASGNTITANGGQGIYVYFGSSAGLAGDTITGNAGNGIELTIDSRANLSGATVDGNNNGIHVSYSHVTVNGANVSGNQRSGLFLTAGRAELSATTITGNGNQGIGGITGSTLRVTGGTISGNGANGVSISHGGTVFIAGTPIQSNGGAGISLSLGSRLLLGSPTDASFNVGWSLDCQDAESSFAGPLIGSIAPGCTGY